MLQASFLSLLQHCMHALDSTIPGIGLMRSCVSAAESAANHVHWYASKIVMHITTLVEPMSRTRNAFEAKQCEAHQEVKGPCLGLRR